MNPGPSRWNDDRLDDFAGNVDKRFDQVDKRFDQVDRRFEQVDKRFDQVDKRFERVEHELARVNDRLDDLVKVLIAGVIALTGAILAGFAGILVLIATQL